MWPRALPADSRALVPPGWRARALQGRPMPPWPPQAAEQARYFARSSETTCWSRRRSGPQRSYGAPLTPSPPRPSGAAESVTGLGRSQAAPDACTFGLALSSPVGGYSSTGTARGSPNGPGHRPCGLGCSTGSCVALCLSKASSPGPCPGGREEDTAPTDGAFSPQVFRTCSPSVQVRNTRATLWPAPEHKEGRTSWVGSSCRT